MDKNAFHQYVLEKLAESSKDADKGKGRKSIKDRISSFFRRNREPNPHAVTDAWNKYFSKQNPWAVGGAGLAALIGGGVLANRYMNPPETDEYGRPVQRSWFRRALPYLLAGAGTAGLVGAGMNYDWKNAYNNVRNFGAANMPSFSSRSSRPDIPVSEQPFVR